MLEKIFLKKYSSEQHQILWQCGEMVEVCSDCVGMCVRAWLKFVLTVSVCVSVWCQLVIWSVIPVFTCSNTP